MACQRNPAAARAVGGHGDGRDAGVRAMQEQLPDGRRPRHRGCVSLVTFFAQALRRRSGANSGAGREAAEGRMPGVKKVTRSPAGRVEALHFEEQQHRSIWIPVLAGMTSGEKGRMDSGFRRNDELKESKLDPACAGKTSEGKGRMDSGLRRNDERETGNTRSTDDGKDRKRRHKRRARGRWVATSRRDS